MKFSRPHKVCKIPLQIHAIVVRVPLSFFFFFSLSFSAPVALMPRHLSRGSPGDTGFTLGFHFTREFPSRSHRCGGGSPLQPSALSRACTLTPAVPARQGHQQKCHECIGRAKSVRRQECVLALVCLPESAFPVDWLLLSPQPFYISKPCRAYFVQHGYLL